MSGTPEPAAAGTVTVTLDEDLQRWVESVTGRGTDIVEPIGRGASRRIWLVRLAGGDLAVVREDTGTGPVAGTPLDLAREAIVYRALAGTGIPIPGVRAVSPDGRALLLDHAPGGERFDSLEPAERAEVACDFGRWLGRLHLLDPAEFDLGHLGIPATGPAHATDDLDLWAGIQQTRTGDHATESAAVALDTLRRHPPGVAARTSLCHGDAGPGNFLHEHGRVTALLDWEFAHVGDPHDDLAWVAVRNQVLRRPVALGDVYRSWRQETGDPIDLAMLEYYRALVLTRMLVSCDATICWAGGQEGAATVQTMLRPYLGLALVEALRRSGTAPNGVDGLEARARATWDDSPIAGVLGDPTKLDDLGDAT